MNNVKPGARSSSLRFSALFPLLILLLPAMNIHAEKNIPRRLSACADFDYPPLSYVQNGLPTGFDLAFINRMGELLRLPVDLRMRTWAETLATLADGRSDFITGCIQTDARDGSFDFTIPYVTDQYFIFSNKAAGIADAGDLSGKRLIILENDAVLDNWVRPAGLDSDLLVTDSLSDVFERINGGDADYTVAPYAMGASLIERENFRNMAVAERPLFPAEFRFAVRKGDAALLAFLNEGIAIMQRTGETERLLKEWKYPLPHSTFASIKSITPFFWIMITVMVAFVLGLAWYYTSYLSFLKRIERLKEDSKFLELVLGSLPYGLRWESLDKTRMGENQLYRLYSGPERKKNIRRKPLEIATMIGDPVGKVVVLEDAARQQELETRLRKMSRELAEKNAQLVEQSIVDPVSGLLNRGFMKSKILSQYEHFRNRNEIFSVILVKWMQNDIDPFSVRSFARRLKGSIGIHDFAGIVEPGLFAVLIPGLNEAEIPAECRKLQKAMSEGGDPYKIECAPYPCAGDNVRIPELLELL